MRVLVDTNILLRSAQPTHPLCSEATSAVSKLLRQQDAVFFCAQNIAEFWNVATRPAEVNGLGFSHEEALQEVASIEDLLILLPDIPAVYPVWKRLVQDHRVQGVKVYDARLVAVMSVYVIDAVLTFNVADFKRYGNVRAIHPASMLCLSLPPPD
jgi:predicted nucleic acid-binding protein